MTRCKYQCLMKKVGFYMIEIYHDNFQNYKKYNIKKAQLVIADIPYNLGVNAYASNPMWYEGGNNKNGESKKAASTFFNGDGQFNIAEYFHFCNKLLIREPKEKGKAPAMIVFCAFEQIPTVVEYGKKHGFLHSYPIIFCKNYSAQVLKANMKIVGATEYAVVLYRDKLPKFNNGRQYDENGNLIKGSGKMIFNWFEWKRDNAKVYPKIHPTQKPTKLFCDLVLTSSNEGDIIFDPFMGSGTSGVACIRTKRKFIGIELNDEYFGIAQKRISQEQQQLSLF